ncbi:MAG: S9 family peptidase, partial [Planctomycetota bacterium]|nr:S9 family peptidase [Planctomycetota bacterium]
MRFPSIGPTCLLLCCGCAATEAPTAYDAATFYATTQMFGASFSADGTRLLVTSDESGVFNAYALEIATGERTQLTDSSSNATYGIGWFPGDDRLLYTADEEGNELNHVFVRQPDGVSIDVTPGEGLKAGFAGWSGDDRSFFVTTNERDARYFDLYRYAIAPSVPLEASGGRPTIGRYPRQLVYENTEGYDVSEVSSDGRWVALTKVRNNADSDVFLVDLENAGSDPIHVTPHEGDISHGVQTFAPDGSKLYYGSNVGSEFGRVWSYDLATGDRRLEYEADWDVSFYDFSRDGRYLVVGVNEDAQTKVRLFDARTGEEIDLPEIPGGEVTGISIERDGRRMAFYVNGDTSPSNLHVLDLATGDYERLTDNLTGKISPDDLVAAEVVRYPSFDGLEIPALLYRPHRASSDDPAPALVWVHGGPGGQSRKGYRPTIQHLVNHGYAVLAVNNRGSSGYGKTFFHLDDRKHGDV